MERERDRESDVLSDSQKDLTPENGSMTCKQLFSNFSCGFKKPSQECGGRNK